ncbi:hypothetical protein OH77DRAFT_67252 [Trametes cingulata]|nr:hypothetical protein OH77DRAFT_67252 [Trametes cingulata]
MRAVPSPESRRRASQARPSLSHALPGRRSRREQVYRKCCERLEGGQRAMRSQMATGHRSSPRPHLRPHPHPDEHRMRSSRLRRRQVSPSASASPRQYQDRVQDDRMSASSVRGSFNSQSLAGCILHHRRIKSSSGRGVSLNFELRCELAG